MHGFPLPFIQTKIKAFFNKKYQNIRTNYTNEQKLYFVLPFFGHQSEMLKIELTNIFPAITNI